MDLTAPLLVVLAIVTGIGLAAFIALMIAYSDRDIER